MHSCYNSLHPIEIMDTAFLDRLAHQLTTDKDPSCRRAINRILEEMKTRCDNGEYQTPMAAESVFSESVENERSCQKPKKI
jgi:hypothetical protein